MKTIHQKGTLLDQRYEVLGIIDQGSFGVVYEARDRQAGSGAPLPVVAVKQMPAQISFDVAQRFASAREMQLALEGINI